MSECTHPPPRILHLMIVLSYMEKHCGHVASLATYSLVYNLCAELDQVVQRSASSSDHQTQAALQRKMWGQCRNVHSSHLWSVGRGSGDGKAERNGSVDLIYNVDTKFLVSIVQPLLQCNDCVSLCAVKYDNTSLRCSRAAASSCRAAWLQRCTY